MLLRKTLALASCDMHVKGEGGAIQFSGYASVFGGKDTYGDTILRGAFESSLKNNGKPKMFYGHTWDMPIGKYMVAKEDDHGLWVEGELTPGHSKAADVGAALKHETIDGLSIGGFVKQSDYDATPDGGRIIRKWSKLVEVSPVVFPADGAARIDLASVKAEDLTAAIAEVESMAQFENFLRDAAGIHGPAAAAFVAKCRALFATRDDGQHEAETKQADDIATAILARRLRHAFS